MRPLRITARLLTPLAAFDDWTPALESVLETFWLMERGLYHPTPNPDHLIETDIPLQKGNFGGDWYWCCSSPCYLIEFEQTSYFYKRWNMQEYHLDWEGRRKTWNDAGGGGKSWVKPLYLRTTASITWFAVGDTLGVAALLKQCHALGYLHAAEVYEWEVTPFEADWHLWGPCGQLMRPIPANLAPKHLTEGRYLQWGWRTPFRLPENRTLCAMPTHTVKRMQEQSAHVTDFFNVEAFG